MTSSPKKINLVKSMFTVGFWTLLSRIFGFLRDILMASFLGSGIIAEAFIIAFALPNMFRRFFAEGALNTAFVPMLSKHIKNKKEFNLFAGNIISWLIILLIFLVLIAEIFMPQLIIIIASGFTGSEKFNLSVDYARIMFPYIFLISIGSAYGSILNSLGYFGITAAAPILLNICLILALLIARNLQFDIGWAITYAIPIAGILQMVAIVLVCYIRGLLPRIRVPRINPETKNFLLLAGPAMLAGGVVQINLLIGRQISSFFEGAVAWLNYADRIYQLPLGVIGIALGVVLLPDLSRKFKMKDSQGAEEAIHKAIISSSIFIFPATIAILIIPHSIIRILFERGEFNSIDTIFTSQALFIFAFGLPAFVLQKVFSPIFFANGNTKTPFNFAVISMLANIIISISLIPFFGFLATAIGTTISGWIMTGLLIFYSREYRLNLDKNKMLKKSLSLILLCSLLMGLYIYNVDLYISKNFESGIIKYLSFLFLILSSALLYLLLTSLLGLLKFLNFKA